MDSSVSVLSKSFDPLSKIAQSVSAVDIVTLETSNLEFYGLEKPGPVTVGKILSISTVKGTEDLLKHATDFYKNLFGRSEVNDFNLDPGLWAEHENVNEQDNWALTKNFEEEEIKEALFDMEKNKEAGPDQIPIEFFQISWEIVKKRYNGHVP